MDMTDGLLKKFLPCTFTENALKEIQKTIQTKNIPPEYGLRVGVKGGGCSGISYLIGFDTLKDSDDVFELEGVRVFIEKRHSMYLVNVSIDFEDGVNARGFVFHS